MASGLNKRKMIQHAVFKELVKVKIYLTCAMIFHNMANRNVFQNTFYCFYGIFICIKNINRIFSEYKTVDIFLL